MKIIYYSPHPHLNLMSASGYGTHMREMIRAFENKGCEVRPVIMGGENNPATVTLQEESNGSKKIIKKLLNKKVWTSLRDLDLLRFDFFTAASRLEDTIEQFSPDLIYERCYYLQTSGIRMAKKYGVRHAMEINSPYVDQAKFLGKSESYLENYARGIEKKQLLATDLPLAVVGPLKDYFCKRHDIDPEKFLITHDAFNQENIRLNRENQQKITDKYHLQDKTIIGYVGSIFEWHGLDKCIRAFDELNLADTKLLIVGYGEYKKTLIELTAELGREEDVIFTGKVPREEVFDYISVMDICVAPDADWYQSPVKLFEYGAMGKPVLGPDTRAVREIMKPDIDGILTDTTKEGIKRGLKKLLDNLEEGRKMGKHFRNKVLAEYTWDNNARRILQAIQRIEADGEGV